MGQNHGKQSGWAAALDVAETQISESPLKLSCLQYIKSVIEKKSIDEINVWKQSELINGQMFRI
jgi:hypothetical protein